MVPILSIEKYDWNILHASKLQLVIISRNNNTFSGTYTAEMQNVSIFCVLCGVLNSFFSILYFKFPNGPFNPIHTQICTLAHTHARTHTHTHTHTQTDTHTTHTRVYIIIILLGLRTRMDS